MKALFKNQECNKISELHWYLIPAKIGRKFTEDFYQ